MLSNEWQKSSFSSNNGSCVEARLVDDTTIEVRDSKNKSGPTLKFTRQEWVAFQMGTNEGEFDI